VQELTRSLVVPNGSKLILFVMDGLGGLPHPRTGKTELETAATPNLDRLAYDGNCGLSQPVAPGISPGSGPGHLALFGYDPLRWEIGRGVLEALGIDFPLGPEDIAARGNFCTVDGEGRIVDRRAGRIPTEVNARLCEKLRQIRLPGVEVFVEPVREHRFVLVLRGPGLSPDLTETDPTREGVPPLPVRAARPEAEATAALVNRWLEEARKLLADEHPANMVLLRGFAKHPHPPTFEEVYKLRAAAVATYPMYRGLARLVGMTVVPTGQTLAENFQTVAERFAEFDFFFVHFKRTDTAGEDGNFEAKVAAIEEADRLIPRLLDLRPDVIVVTGDHSTPAVYRSHSWHPVPVVLWSRWCRPDRAEKFGETTCRHGGLGLIPATAIMPLMLAHAGRLTRFGA
jgi:2,3-bisphosphoglycerate-independent phosphoglycerate mutase